MKVVRLTLLTVAIAFQGFAAFPPNLAVANQTPERKLAVYELEPRTGLSLADAARVSRLMDLVSKRRREDQSATERGALFVGQARSENGRLCRRNNDGMRRSVSGG